MTRHNKKRRQKERIVGWKHRNGELRYFDYPVPSEGSAFYQDEETGEVICVCASGEVMTFTPESPEQLASLMKELEVEPCQR